MSAGLSLLLFRLFVLVCRCYCCCLSLDYEHVSTTPTLHTHTKASVAEAQKSQKLMGKKVKRGDREFQELVDEMVVDLVQQNMDAAGEAAKQKAEDEHEVRRFSMTTISSQVLLVTRYFGAN